MTTQKPPTDLVRAAGTTKVYRDGFELEEVPLDRLPPRAGVVRDGAVLKDAPEAGSPAVPPAGGADDVQAAS